MFKTGLFLALCSTSLYAQDIQALVNQAGSTVGGFLSDLGGVQRTEDSIALNVNEYEWVLTSYDGELEFSISELSSNANNLAPAVAALLAGASTNAQDNADAVSQAIDSQNPGIVVNDGGLEAVASQYSPQLNNENVEALTEQVQNAYNQAAVALINNENGVLDQVNEQLNNAANGDQAANVETLNNVLGEAIANAPSLDNINVNADDVPALLTLSAPIAEAVSGGIAGVDTNQVVEAYNNAAGAASNGLNNLPAGVSNAVNNIASNTANAAGAQLSASANDLANQALNSAAASNILSSAANNLAGQALNDAAASSNLLSGATNNLAGQALNDVANSNLLNGAVGDLANQALNQAGNLGALGGNQ